MNTLDKAALIMYAIAVIGCIICLPIREELPWWWYCNLPGIMTLALSVLGALLVKYVVFDKREFSWWMTLFTFIGLFLLYGFVFFIEDTLII